MLKLSLTTMLAVGIGITGAACQDYGPRGANHGYGPQLAQSWPPYQNNGQSWPPYQNNGQRYTTVTVTNRGQNGYPDQVVQQQVACGSQYYDGYRHRIAQC